MRVCVKFVGITVSTPDGTMTAHAALLVCCVDLPAQAKVLNMKQFNGANGCHICEDPGVPRVHAPMTRDWPYTSRNVVRTPQSFKQNAQQAIQDGRPVSR